MVKIKYTIISFLIMMGSTLLLFNMFPMETTKPNHDLMIIIIGFMLGGIAFFYMEEHKLFQPKTKQN